MSRGRIGAAIVLGAAVGSACIPAELTVAGATGGSGATGGGATGGGAMGGAAGSTATCTGSLVWCDEECVDVQNDARHCGRCGLSCESGSCTGALCEPIDIWPSPAANGCHGVAISADGATAYVTIWSNGEAGGLVAIDLETRDATELDMTKVGASWVVVNGQAAYWTTQAASVGVWQTDLESGITTAVPCGSCVHENTFGLTMEGGVLFWADIEAWELWRWDPEEASGTPLAWSLPGAPYCLAGLDGWIYTAHRDCDGEANGCISRVPANGTDADLEVIHEAVGVEPWGIAARLDGTWPQVLFTRPGGAEMLTQSASGWAHTTFDGQPSAEGSGIMVAADRAFWGQRTGTGTGSLWAKRLDQDIDASALSAFEPEVIGVAEHDGMLYWCTNDGLRAMPVPP